MALTPDTIAELNALAAEVFAAAYRGSPAEAYANSRGFRAETATHWRFGYAVPSATNLLDRLGAAGWPEGTLVEAGLCRPSERGTIDMFRDRLVFPILDRDGVRILGFGSRRLRDDDKAIPKYVNSPATPLFAKNETLYGWPNMAAIIAAGEAIVVEGNLDMIAVHQAGIHNVVAACGTAVTAEHLYAAGQAATRRTLLLDAAGHFDVGVAVMAGGKDPAELLAAPDGLPAFRALLANRVNRWDHLAALTIAPYAETLESDVEARVAYKDAWTKLVAEHADDRATGERLLAPMAARLGLDARALATEYLPADAPRAGEGNDELLLLALAEKWSERRHIADLLPLNAASRSVIDTWGDEPRLTARLRDRALRDKSAAEQAFLLVARRDIAPALRTRISQTSAAVVAGTVAEEVGLASVAADRVLLAALDG